MQAWLQPELRASLVSVIIDRARVLHVFWKESELEHTRATAEPFSPAGTNSCS